MTTTSNRNKDPKKPWTTSVFGSRSFTWLHYVKSNDTSDLQYIHTDVNTSKNAKCWSTHPQTPLQDPLCVDSNMLKKSPFSKESSVQKCCKHIDSVFSKKIYKFSKNAAILSSSGFPTPKIPSSFRIWPLQPKIIANPMTPWWLLQPSAPRDWSTLPRTMHLEYSEDDLKPGEEKIIFYM